MRKAIATIPELQTAYETEPMTREVVEAGLVLEDLTRNASVHAAGVVIGPEPLVNLLPLKLDDAGGIVTQYAMGPVGELGLLKMDFLGLKTLTVIRNTCELLRRTRGIEVPIDHLPLDDAPTYDLLNKANTLGVFQLESGGMRDLCRRFQISSIEHLTALIALYRPGPMDLIPDFLRRRHGEIAIEYEHPLLEPICRETYGIMVYQEQVMQAAQVLAGYTLGGADVLRRAMGKKMPEEMERERAKFVQGCRQTNHIPPAQANRIFDLLVKFAGYGFNKSHAAAYAVVAYQTAYLKAHYPVEFFCAMMTNDMADTDKLGQYIEEARLFGIEVLGPDVNESELHFAPGQVNSGPSDRTTAPRAIRFGLAAIKGVGEVAVQSLLEARAKGGRFASLADFCERVDSRAVNRKAIEAFIKSGACDSFGETRATLWASLDRTLARAATAAQDRARGQANLFGLMETGPVKADDTLVRVPEWPQSELLAAEKELLGFYVTGHPLTPYAPLLNRYALATTRSLGELPNRSMTRIGGLVSTVQTGVSKKSGKAYALVTLEDLTGSVQVLCLNEVFDKFRDLLKPLAAVMILGEVNHGEDKPKIFPQEILPLEEAPRRFTQEVFLRLHAAHLDPERLKAARALLEAHPGRCPVLLSIEMPAGEVVFVEPHDHYRVTPSAELAAAADRLFGEGTYQVRVDRSVPNRAPRRWEKRNGNG
ncbi:MAG: DNA polymerase III subunit alpha [Verrucomicrobia bacterium]|nr:DNA polymerase III subunit alpha [Verrucomicrobiota bacterium]